MSTSESTSASPERSPEDSRYVAVIPAYHEGRHIANVVRTARACGITVLVVDDGSADDTAAKAEAAGARVVRHETNRGKGSALTTGFSWALEHDANAVITLDADGQHDPQEIPSFIEAYERTGFPVLVGNRLWNPEGMPWIRRWTNRYMSGVLSREMEQYVPDTQCGFRLYRCDLIPFVTAHSTGFAAESELLLHIADRGIRIGAVRIRTIYRDEKSRIKPIRDTIRFYRMLAAHRNAHRMRRENQRREES